MITVQDAIKKASTIPSWTEPDEKVKLAELAQEVGTGRIVEVGALYGGTTAVMALANPEANITSIDEFSWTPEGCPTACKKLMHQNLLDLGIANFEIIEGDSRNIGRHWSQPIDLLFVDGGHSYEYVHADLVNFGPSAKVIALHDFGNAAWPSVMQAVKNFMDEFPDMFKITEVVGTVAVLRRP